MVLNVGHIYFQRGQFNIQGGQLSTNEEVWVIFFLN